MIGAGYPRRQRALVAGAVMAALYGLVALMWFSGREDAWAKSRKAYEKAERQYAGECALIAKRGEWQARAEEVAVKMPVAETGESTQTRWQRILERIAAENSVSIQSEQPKAEEEHGGVWELPIEVKYEAALGKLVGFLYALTTEEGAMLDVRDLEITAKNNGWLSGKFTLTSAYMRGGAAPAAGDGKK